MNAAAIRTLRQTFACALLSAFCLSNAAAQTPRYRIRDVVPVSLSHLIVAELNNQGEMILTESGHAPPRLIYRRGETVIDYGAHAGITRINRNGEIIRSSVPIDPFRFVLDQVIFNLRTGVATPLPTSEIAMFTDWRDDYGVGRIGIGTEQHRQFVWQNGAFYDVPPLDYASDPLFIFSVLAYCNARGQAISVYSNEGKLNYWNGSALTSIQAPANWEIDIVDFNDNEHSIGSVLTPERSSYFRGKGLQWEYAEPEDVYRKLNNRGEILGSGRSPHRPNYSEFVVIGGQRYFFTDLLPEPYRTQDVFTRCINDYGQIGGFWIPALPEVRAIVLSPQARVIGTVQSNALSLDGQAVSVTMQSNLPQVTENIIVGANGAVTLDIDKDVPVTLRFHAPRHLIRAVSLAATAEDAPLGAVALVAGDANDDNAIDIADLLIVIAHYNQIQGVGDYLEACDFNGDSANDIADLLLLIAHYNQQGD